MVTIFISDGVTLQSSHRVEVTERQASGPPGKGLYMDKDFWYHPEPQRSINCNKLRDIPQNGCE